MNIFKKENKIELIPRNISNFNNSNNISLELENDKDNDIFLDPIKETIKYFKKERTSKNRSTKKKK